MLSLLSILICICFAAPLQHGRYFISGTPSESELVKFRQNKGAVILDLRSIDELGNCSEPATATKVGLQYGRVNFDKKATIDPQVMAEIEKSVQGVGDKPILLFCKTGNRAAAWLAIHMVQKEKMPLEEALNIARPMGLKSEMEQSVRAYLANATLN